MAMLRYSVSMVMLVFAIFVPRAGAQDAVNAGSVLDDYVEALGGRAAIERIETRVTRGSLRFAEVEGQFMLYQRVPDHYRMVQIFPFGEVDFGYDGDQAWRTIPGQGRVPMEGEELEDQKFQFSLHQPLLIGEAYSISRQADIRSINDRPMHVLEFTSHSGGRQQWFFDADTHLLARVEAEVETPDGVVPVLTSYDEWKDVGGVLVPHEAHSRFGELNVHLDFESVQHNLPLDDQDFAPGGQP